MFIFLTTFIFILPKKLFNLILFAKIKNSRISEIIQIMPFVIAIVIESVSIHSFYLLSFAAFALIYLFVYVLFSKKILNKLKYNLKLYNMSELKYIESNNKIFYVSKLMILILFLFYSIFQNIFFVYILALFILISMIIYLKIAKKKQVVLQEKYDNKVIEVLNNYQPEFVFYFSAPNANYLYHILMWLPYLKKTNLNFYIMVREVKYLKKILELISDVPIVVADRLSLIEMFLPQSTKLAFYANNGTKNTHMVRFNNIIHILLLHGDSEKPPSYNPIAKMYDKLFVSGQRAIDRYYENNVQVNKENFTIVGRPQISNIKQRENIKIKDVYTVLFAPTWQGLYTDSQFSSLSTSYELVKLLLGRKETIKIIIRLHPLTGLSDLDTQEVLKKVKEILDNDNLEHICFSTREIEDDFNDSDMIITDISSVPIDYIYSNKAIVHVDINNLSRVFKEDIKYRTYSKAVYIIDNEFKNFNQVLNHVFYNDILFEARNSVKEYYHGNLSESPENVFTKQVCKLLNVRKS